MKITPKQIKRVFLPNDPDGAWIDIIYLKPGVRKQIEQEANTMTATQKDGVFTPLLEMNKKNKRKAFFKEVIDDMGGFTDSNSNPLPVALESFELINRELDNFHDWLQEESDTFIKEVEDALKKSKGN